MKPTKAMNQGMLNETISQKDSDPPSDMEGVHDLHELDAIKIDKKKFTIGLIKAILLSSVAILAFFVQFEIGGNSDILYGHIYKNLQEFFGIVGFWAVNILITGNAILAIYGKYFAKESSRIGAYYSSDTIVHLIMYSIGSFFIMWYVLYATFSGLYTPEWLIRM